MSMQMCAACEQIKDSDFIQFDTINGEEVCESCWPDEDESIVPHPRTALFRLAEALSIAEFTKRAPTPTEEQDMADCAPEGTYHDHDHDADWPAECEVCRGPIRQGFGNFCSDAHRKIIDGEPTMQEQALNR